MAAVTAQTAAQQSPAAVLCLLIFLLVLSPSPTRPISSLGFDGPPTTHPPSASLIPLSSTDTWLIQRLEGCKQPPLSSCRLPGMCHTAHVPSLGVSPPSPSDDVCALTTGVSLLRMWVHGLEPWNWFWDRMENSYVWETWWQLLRYKTAVFNRTHRHVRKHTHTHTHYHRPNKSSAVWIVACPKTWQDVMLVFHLF